MKDFKPIRKYGMLYNRHPRVHCKLSRCPSLTSVLESWAFYNGMSLSLDGIGLAWASQAGGIQQVEGDQHVVFL